jgi:hypothetical protein
MDKKRFQYPSEKKIPYDEYFWIVLLFFMGGVSVAISVQSFGALGMAFCIALAICLIIHVYRWIKND